MVILVVMFLTSPVLGLEDQRQLAGRNGSGHFGGAVRQAVLAGGVQRRVAVLVLQLQAGPLLQQGLHHVFQVQVDAQVQRSLTEKNVQLKLFNLPFKITTFRIYRIILSIYVDL